MLNRAQIQVRGTSLSELTAADLAAWTALEQAAGSPSPFLSPHFVQAAFEHLPDCEPPVLIVMEHGGNWLGLGIFEAVGATRRIPVPHLRSWRTEYSFLNGLLLRPETCQLALAALWDFLQNGRHRWHALELTLLPHDACYFEPLHESAHEQGIEMWRSPVTTRACLHLEQDSTSVPNFAEAVEFAATDWSETPAVSEQGLTMSQRRARSLRRGWNWLNRQGQAAVSLSFPTENDSTSRDRFLQLEAMGWKAEEGTALASTPASQAFFEQMLAGFTSENRVRFLELAVNEQIIGSVVHLLAGEVSHAFKLGWDPQWARGCPGYQMKAHTAELFQTLAEVSPTEPRLRLIDSCACPGSFIEHVWPGRRSFSSTIFLTSRAAVIAGSIIGTLRWIRNCGRKMISSGASTRENNE